MKIVKVTHENYHEFDNMIFWRVHGRERTVEEKLEVITSKDTLDELENKNLYIYSAMIESKMVGWISLIYMPKVGKYEGKGHIYVDELWLQPSYRCKGIAERLMNKADELKCSLNASGIRLYVSRDNITANKLYEKCGYSYSGETYFMEK